MKIRIRKSAIKDLKKINKAQKQKIHSKILSLKDFPEASNVKKLTNFEPPIVCGLAIIVFYLMLLMIALRLVGCCTGKKVINNG